MPGIVYEDDLGESQMTLVSLRWPWWVSDDLGESQMTLVSLKTIRWTRDISKKMFEMHRSYQNHFFLIE